MSDPDRDKGLPSDPLELVRLADALTPHPVSEKPPELEKTDRALSALERALAQKHPRPIEVLWRASRACFMMTEAMSNDKQRHVYARRGIDYSQRAIRIDAGRVEPHLFLALNTAKVAEATANARLIRSMMAEAMKAAKINKAYEDAGPLRFMGKVYIMAPAWPVSVGNPEKAVEVLKEAVKLSPIPLNLIFLGQAYYLDEDYENAERVLRKALDHSRITRVPDRWRKEAQEYLRRIGMGSTTDPRTTL